MGIVNRTAKAIERREMKFKREYDLITTLIIAIAVLFLVLFTLVLESQAQVVTVDLNKIAMIESSGGKFKIHKDGWSKGTHGISKITLKEWNNFNPRDKHVFNDLMDDDVSLKISKWYINKRIPQMLRYYKQEDTLKNRLWAYNCGISCVIDNRIPKITQAYFRKYGEL